MAPAQQAIAAPAPLPQLSPQPLPEPAAVATPPPAASGGFGWLRNPFAAKPPVPASEAAPVVVPPPVAAPVSAPVSAPEPTPTPPVVVVAKPIAVAAPPASAAQAPTPATELPPPAERTGWLNRLKAGLRKTGSSIATVFTGTQIDDALYEELEEALLMADTGVKATQWLLTDLRRRVKETKTTDPAAVKGLLADALADLLRPLEKALVIGEHTPTVIMVAGVNGAGKTTSIGKLTKHLANEGASVLLAASAPLRANNWAYGPTATRSRSSARKAATPPP